MSNAVVCALAVLLFVALVCALGLLELAVERLLGVGDEEDGGR